jgi:hypothetical protein
LIHFDIETCRLDFTSQAKLPTPGGVDRNILEALISDGSSTSSAFKAQTYRRPNAPIKKPNSRITFCDHHGLGLSIVRAIAIAHDATLIANAGPQGRLPIEIHFPLIPFAMPR